MITQSNFLRKNIFITESYIETLLCASGHLGLPIYKKHKLFKGLYEKCGFLEDF